MPELAEVKLTSDYINLTCYGVIFNNIVTITHGRKNPIILQPYHEFYIQSESRGKELVLYLINKHILIVFKYSNYIIII